MTRPFQPRLKIHSDRFAAIAVTMAPLFYFLPALLHGSVLCPDDGTIFNTPLRVAIANIARGGSFPLWNPHIFSGMPLLAAAQGGILFPPNWFYLVLNPVAGTNAMVVSSYMIAALGSYLYARRSGNSITGAIVTSLCWQWGGFLIGQIGHINIVQTGAMLPWVLWTIDGNARLRDRKWAFLVSLAIALQIFAGHQQTTLYSLLLVTAYVIFSALSSRNKLYWRSLVFVGAGVVLSAIQILPTLELLQHSLRAETSYDFFTSFSMPRTLLKTFFAPYLFGGGDGRLFRVQYFGPPFYGELVGYVSLLGLMLALVALFVKRRAIDVFWGVIAVVCLVLTLGRFSPLHVYKLLYFIPVLNLFRVPARHLMEAEFALAVLAGHGATKLSAIKNKQALVRVSIIAGCVLIATCLIVIWGRPVNLQLARQVPVTFLRAPELFFPVLLAVLSALALIAFARHSRKGAAMLLLVLAFDLCVWGQSSGWYFSSPKSDHEMFRTPGVVEAIENVEHNAPSSYRILTTPHSFDPAVAPVPPSVSHSTDWVLWTQPDIYMMYNLQNAAGYDGFGLARYSRMAGDMKVWGELMDPDRSLRGATREIDLLNVKYLISIAGGADGKHGGSTNLKPLLPYATTEIGGIGFADNDLGLPSLTAGKEAVLNLENTPLTQVALITNLSWSEEVPDGTEVATLRMSAANGRAFEFPLRAGADTAEWAYDRADIHARIRHKRPLIATSYSVSDAKTNFAAHTYLSKFTLPERAEIVSATITLKALPKWPDVLLSVFRVSLIDSTANRTFALDRNSIKVTTNGNAALSGTALPTQHWRFIKRISAVDIFENTRALPRAWLATDWRSLDDRAILQTIRNAQLPDGNIWEPKTTALLETPINIAPAVNGNSGQCEITRYSANRIDLNANSSVPAVLVLSENYYPGWRAYVDGKRVEILRTDFNLRGVVLPAGSHQITFVYRPMSFFVGLIVSLLTAIALLAYWQRSPRSPQKT